MEIFYRALQHVLTNIDIHYGQNTSEWLSSLKLINNNIFGIWAMILPLLIYWKIVLNQDYLLAIQKRQN